MVTVTALLLVPLGVSEAVPVWPLEGSTTLIVQATEAVRSNVNVPSFLAIVLTVVCPAAVAVTKAQGIAAAEEFLAVPWTLPSTKLIVDSKTPEAGTVMFVIVRTPVRSLAG